MESKFIFFFIMSERTITIALGQKVGTSFIPLTSLYEWPIVDSWGEIRTFVLRNKWISDREGYDILSTLTKVLNCWEKGDPKIIRSVSGIRKEFPQSLYPNFLFLGETSKRA